MKKFLSIFCAIIILSNQAEAKTGLFAGVDGLHSTYNAKTRSNDGGYGLNLGARIDPLMFFASAEIFYEKLNSSARFKEQTAGGLNIKLDDRYGAKANLGLTVLPWLTPFITYGMARINYHSDIAGNKTAPLYGVGIMFDIPATDFSIKVAYDVQRFDINHRNGQSESSSLGVAHLGLTYTF